MNCQSIRTERGENKTGTDFNSPFDMLIDGEAIVSVLFPEELDRKVNKLFSKARNVNEIEQERFVNILFNEQHKIPMFINRDKTVAESLRKLAENCFKTNRHK